VSGYSFSLPPELVESIAERAAEIVLERLDIDGANRSPASPYVTVLEAAELLRAKRHRVDDLLSQGRLTRVKDGTRTLIARVEVEDYLAGRPTGRRR
jgi:excisionase family DNA binding protein